LGSASLLLALGNVSARLMSFSQKHVEEFNNKTIWVWRFFWGKGIVRKLVYKVNFVNNVRPFTFLLLL
jgi:hypothetical protein